VSGINAMTILKDVPHSPNLVGEDQKSRPLQAELLGTGPVVTSYSFLFATIVEVHDATRNQGRETRAQPIWAT